MSAAILEGRTLRAYTNGLGLLDNAVRAPRLVSCPSCKGVGGNLFTVADYPTFDPPFWMDCEVCDGTGSVTHLFGVHAVFEGHADTPGLLRESAALEASGGAASGLTHRPDSEDTGRGAGVAPAPCAVPMPMDPADLIGTDPELEEYQRTHRWMRTPEGLRLVTIDPMETNDGPGLDTDRQPRPRRRDGMPVRRRRVARPAGVRRPHLAHGGPMRATPPAVEPLTVRDARRRERRHLAGQWALLFAAVGLLVGLVMGGAFGGGHWADHLGGGR